MRGRGQRRACAGKADGQNKRKARETHSRRLEQIQAKWNGSREDKAIGDRARAQALRRAKWNHLSADSIFQNEKPRKIAGRIACGQKSAENQP
jgi:hypothetical protein